jgi:predicted AAA+ superfamily ATPase
MIERKRYIEKLAGYREKQLIKVITGIRRCGKSTLLSMYADLLRRESVPTERIVEINFEDFANEGLLDKSRLHAHALSKLKGGEMTYLFLDEVQRVEGFERVVDSLFLRPNVDIYITGSNANLLSGELATLLSGRYVEIELLPLSFAEYISTSDDSRNLDARYSEYLTYSSFPYATELDENQEHIDEYLTGIYNTVLVKDIASRNQLTDVMLLESVARFCFDSIGSRVSSKKIADTLASSGRKTDVKTIEKYLRALTDSFILYKSKRYDIKGKQHLKTLEKYYAVDNALRRVLLGNRAPDVGHVLENTVYLELRRRGGKVFTGKIGSSEVDFVHMLPGGRVEYYQVAATVRAEETLERELAPLRIIRDHAPKFLLTLDDDPDAIFDGIVKTNALRWLAHP